MRPKPGEQDGVVAVSFVTVDWCLGVSWICCRLASVRVGTHVQPVLGENYMYSRVLGHVQLLIRLHFHGVVLPDFYLTLV